MPGETETPGQAGASRLPGLRMAVPEDRLAWNTMTMLRGLTAFPISW